MLEFRNVSKSFGDRKILRDISFKVDKGEIVFILGTSGTGKSVTLKLLVGLLQATEGRIFVQGKEITSLAERELFSVRKSCGMVFQHPALFDSINVRENIAFGMRRHFRPSEEDISKKVEEYLSLVQLKGIEDRYPQELSYGTQKRVSLARTLAVEPDILLFDEPTTGLDPISTTAINELIQSLSRRLKTTSIVVSHDMKCALAIADRIIVLDKGEVVATGSPDQLLNSEVPLVRDFLSEVKDA